MRSRRAIKTRGVAALPREARAPEQRVERALGAPERLSSAQARRRLRLPGQGARLQLRHRSPSHLPRAFLLRRHLAPRAIRFASDVQHAGSVPPHGPDEHVHGSQQRVPLRDRRDLLPLLDVQRSGPMAVLDATTAPLPRGVAQRRGRVQPADGLPVRLPAERQHHGQMRREGLVLDRQRRLLSSRLGGALSPLTA